MFGRGHSVAILTRKKFIEGCVAIGLSIFLLFLAFRSVDFDATFSAVKQVNLFYVWLSGFSIIFAQIVRTYRLNVLVSPFAELSTIGLFRVANLGSALILLLPFRLGEFAKPYLIKKEANVSMAAGFGASAVERLIDGLAAVLLYVIVSANLPVDYAINSFLKYSAIVAGSIFGTATIILTLGLLYHEQTIRLIKHLKTPFSPKLNDLCVNLVTEFISGLKSLPNLGSLLKLLVMTLLYFILNAFSFYAVMLAFGWDLPIVSSFLLMCVVFLGIMIPAGPGFLGTYQAALTLGLSIFEIGPSEAAAFGFVIYPLSVFIIVALGLPFLIGVQRPSLTDRKVLFS
jgi:glycosyltransferase 2 family protein